ncbi:MAG: LacI family DNA-binding transcriptional regulator [Verrucomicrobiota bacterium]
MSQPVTLKTIAEKAGVNPSTVSRALRNHSSIPIATRKKIQKIAKSLNYQPNSFGLNLAAQRHYAQAEVRALLACLIGHREWNPMEYVQFYELLFQGAQRRAEQQGYLLELFWVYDEAYRGKALQRILRARSVQGLVLMAVDPSELSLKWEDFSVATIHEGHKNRMFHSVKYDYFQVIQLAIDRVVGHGYQKIGLFCNHGLDTNSKYQMTGGFHVGCEKYKSITKIDPFYYQAPQKRRELEKDLRQWLERYQPDCVLTAGGFIARTHQKVIFLRNILKEQLAQLGNLKTVVVDLEMETEESSFAGMRIPLKEMGATTIDLITAQLYRGERGFVTSKKTVHMLGEWRSGSSSL